MTADTAKSSSMEAEQPGLTPDSNETEASHTAVAQVYRNRWLIAIALLVFVYFCTSAVVSYRSMSIIDNSNRDINNSLEIISLIKELKTTLVQAESGQRGYLLTIDEQYLEPYHQSMRRIDRLLEELRLSRTLIPEQQQRFIELYNLTHQKLTEMRATVAQVENNLTGAAINLIRTDIGVEVMEEINELITVMLVDEAQLMRQKQTTAQENRTMTLVILVVTNLIGLLLVLGIFSLSHRYSRRMADLNMQVERANAALETQVEARTRQLKLYSLELERSNRELEEFAFVASHDLQEPLRKIQAFGNRLNQKYQVELGERGADYIARMNSASLRMSELIQDLLSFSRVSTQQQPFEAVDLDIILAETLDDLEIAIEKHQAQVSHPPLPEIEGDASQLRQVFMNLISNSLKFCPEDRTPHIRLDFDRSADYAPAEDEREWLRLRFQDNGIGFDDEYRERVFLLFQRLHGRDEYSGTGIGLALCRKIIERHGGTIEAEGEPDKGAIFTILLPVTQVKLADLPDE